MDNIKSEEEWRSVVAKHFLLAALMKDRFWSFWLIPWRGKDSFKTTHYKVSLCKYTGTTKSGFSSHQLMLKKDEELHLFKIPNKHYGLHHLMGEHYWTFSNFTFWLGDDCNLAAYFTANAIVFDELFTNINDLYWNNTHVMEIDHPEQWIIEHELNMPDSTIREIDRMANRIWNAEQAKRIEKEMHEMKDLMF